MEPQRVNSTTPGAAAPVGGTLGAGIVNVCGCGSSGSTMLAYTLDRHPEIACGDELFLFCIPTLYDDYARFRRHRHLYRFIGVSGNPYHQGRAIFRQARAYGLGRSALWGMAGRARSLNELAATMQAHVQARTGKRLWAEKTPRNIRVIGKFVDAFPEAKVIHIVRDPRDVLLSLARRGKPLLESAETWIASTAAIAAHRGNPRLLEVRYEDLCREPDATLARICLFLDVTFDPEYFRSDRFASQGLGKFAGHASWTQNPGQGFSAASIGRHRTVDFDWNALTGMRLTKAYAALLGTPQLRLGELATHYGYDLLDTADRGDGTPFETLDTAWRLDPVRRALDTMLDMPGYVPMVEHQPLASYDLVGSR
ncbi:MAG: sulfotransferase [Pseudomonadales bacterium]|nr:sulfotransferase [Pseudomonadales bacterium]